MVIQLNEHGYGQGDTSYQQAGKLEGIEQLVNRFYDLMNELDEARKIRDMHPSDLLPSRQKLTYFLSGWLGGPRLYAEHYGEINIPAFHQQLDIGSNERDLWLLCMQQAINEQNYTDSFKQYLYQQLCVPAHLIEKVCSTT